METTKTVTESVPVVIKRRINALRNIQTQMVDVEAKLFEELHQLECKYASLYEPFYDRREKIVSGAHEPTDDEAKWEAVSSEENGKKEENGSGASEDAKGLPDFWLKTFKSTALLSGMVQDHDEQVLKHLKDVRVKLHTSKPYGYTLEFHFNKNEFFSNEVLTKTYELSSEKDKSNLLSFEGGSLHKCLGTNIEWAQGKDITTKTVKKKQTAKGNGNSRGVSKEEKQDSFFAFFETHTPDGIKPAPKEIAVKLKAEDDEDEDAEEEVDHLFELDFEIGQFFKDTLIPKASLYYSGDLNEETLDDEFDDDDDDDEDDNDDDDDDDDEDDDESKDKEDDKNPRKKNKPSIGGK